MKLYLVGLDGLERAKITRTDGACFKEVVIKKICLIPISDLAIVRIRGEIAWYQSNHKHIKHTSM
jgi:hypothetical protein